MTLDRNRWQRLQAHFDRLTELEPGARQAAWSELDLSADDLEQLSRLVDAHDQPDSLLDAGSAAEVLAIDLEADPDLGPSGYGDQWAGQRLGPWEIGQRIARGGMSVVHQARRADGQFDKTVAIKLLDGDRLPVFERHRLAEEVRILALLEHPGIARLIDSGSSDEGQIWLAMEYVDGLPIDQHVRNRGPSVRQRIELILQVARALDYAHQRQVIHCDVKPANILVTPDGQARVVDFGIAALIQRQSAGQQEQRLYCSPSYAAPERLAGSPPTTRQDVFSLGAVLYKLLTGHGIRPRDRLTGWPASDEITPPSQTLDVKSDLADKLDIQAHELRGDLDAICLQALHADPEQRYASMGELLRDLENHLGRRPVSARNGGQLYALGCWIRRHSVAAALTALLLGSILSGALVALDQARRANLEAERALAARDFLIRILEAADPTREYGHDPTASELLRRGAERIDEELADRPALRIELLQTIGTTQLERGLIDDAVDSMERALAALSEHSRHSAHAPLLAARGMAAYEQGDYAAAIDFLRRARTLAIEHALPAKQLTEIEIQLAEMLVVDHQAEPALSLIEQVLNRPLDRIQQADALRIKGSALEIADQLEQARAVLHEALDLQTRIDPAHVTLAKIENDLGIVYWRLMDFDQAAEQFDASWRHKVLIYGQDHPQTLASLGNLAGVHSVRGDHAAAIDAYRLSLDGLIRVHGNEPHLDIAYTWGMLAISHYRNEDLSTAAAALEKALSMGEGLADPESRSVRWTSRFAALLAFERGERVESSALTPDLARCDNFAQIAPLDQRLCLAAWINELQNADSCPDALPAAIDANRSDGWPERWQRHWDDLQQRCLPP